MSVGNLDVHVLLMFAQVVQRVVVNGPVEVVRQMFLIVKYLVVVPQLQQRGLYDIFSLHIVVQQVAGKGTQRGIVIIKKDFPFLLVFVVYLLDSQVSPHCQLVISLQRYAFIFVSML